MKRCKFTQFAFANLGKTITEHKNDLQSKCLRKDNFTSYVITYHNDDEYQNNLF